MPKEKKIKLFELVGKFEIGIVIPADTKAEAVAYANDNFAELVLVDTNELNNVALKHKRMVKVKVKKFTVEEGENTNDSQQG